MPWQLACTNTARDKPEPLLQPLEVVDAGVGRRVGAVGGVRERVAGPEDVAVRVARAGRWRERGAAAWGVGCGGGIVAFRSGSRAGKTTPSISLRAVRMMPARPTSSVPSAANVTSIEASNVPVGCSTDDRPRSAPALAAREAAGEPGSRAAVATDTAPSTPIASWQRWGMNVRVLRSPPSRGGATSVSLGTVVDVDVAEVHQRPGLQPDRPRAASAARSLASSSARFS